MKCFPGNFITEPEILKVLTAEKQALYAASHYEFLEWFKFMLQLSIFCALREKYVLTKGMVA